MKRLHLSVPLLILLVWLSMFSAAQEDGLNLPTELYILLNGGTVERYGLGAAGVETITPEDAFILDFAIAPDGNWLAYRTETALNLTDLIQDDNPTITLEDETADFPAIRGRGETMVWSPNADALAYTTTYGLRVAFNVAESPVFFPIALSPVVGLSWSPDGTYLVAEVENNVWWVYQRRNTELVLVSAIPSSFGTTWFSDTQLIFAPAEGGLRLMDLGNANAQTLLLNESRVYALPYLRRDGTLVAFSQPVNSEDGWVFEQLSVINNSATVLSTSENALPSLVATRWAPEGRLLIQFTGGVLLLILPSSGQGFPLPIANAVAYGWGAPRPENVTGLTLPADGYFLAPGDDGRVQVWRLPANGLPASPLTLAAADVTEYAISPDETRLTYISEGQLWILDLARADAEPAILTPVDESARDLTFSVTGDEVAYVTLTSPFSNESGVWTIPADGGEAQLILPNDLDENDSPLFTYREPQYAPNFNALLVMRQTGDSRAYYLFDPVAGELTEVGEYDSALWLEDGRLLGFQRTDGEVGTDVFLMNPAIQPVVPELVFRAGNGWIEDAQGINAGQFRTILRGESVPGQTFLSLEEVSLSGGESNLLARVDYMTQPQISPDGAFVAGYIQPDGTLALYDVSSGEQVVLSSPTNIRTFQWAD